VHVVDDTDSATDNGRKRRVVVDTMGLLRLVVITSAGVRDRDGARKLLDRLKMALPSLSLLWADGGYAGKLLDWVDRVPHITVEIVRKPVGIKVFQALPRRWVVERTFAWIVKGRRLDHDYERLSQTNEAMIKWAMIGLMVRRLEPPRGRTPWQHASTAA
jgi:transposase